MTNLDVSLRLKMVNQLGAGAKAAEKDLKGVKDAAQQIGKGAATEKLGRDLAQAGGKARIARKDVGDLRREAERLGSTRGRASQMAADFDRIGRSARTARGEVDALARAQGRTSGRAHRAGPSVAGRGLEAEMGAGAAVGALGMRVVAPIGVGYGAKRALDQAVDFEAGMAEVRKKVDMNGPGDLIAIEKLIRQMAMDYGIARTEMAGLTAEAGAAGIAMADLSAFMKLTAKASIGWDMAPRDASQALAEIKSGLQMSIPDMAVLADKINALGDNSAAKEADIVRMFQVSGAAAKAAGVDIDTTLAVLTGAKSMGIQADVASRWWGAFSSRFAAGFKGKKSKEALAALGLDERTLQKNIRIKPFETITDFMERLDRAGDKKVGIATALFGAEWFDETLRVIQGLAEIRKQRDMLRDPSKWRGSLEKGLEIQLGTTKNHMERLKVLTSEVGDRLSRWALPPINSGIEWLIAKFDAITDKSSVFSRNMAYLEQRWPDLFGKGDKAPDPVKEPDNAPWSRLAGDRLSRAGQLQAEAEKAREAYEAAPSKTKADKAKKAGLKATADAAAAAAAGERRSAGAMAARDETGLAEGEAAARGLRDRRVAGEKAWAAQAEELALQRFFAQRDRESWLPRHPREKRQADMKADKADKALGDHLGVGDADRAAKAMGLLAGIVEQSRRAASAARPADRVAARGNVARLKKEWADAMGGNELEPALRAALERYVKTLGDEGDKAVDLARKIAAEMIQQLSIEAHPKITPQVAPIAPGAGAAPAPTPGKQSAIGAPVAPVAHTTIHQHIHGGDSRRVAQLARHEQEREIRRARAGALHDTGAWV